MRRIDREVTDINEMRQIVEKAKILHLGLFDSEYPYPELQSFFVAGFTLS